MYVFAAKSFGRQYLYILFATLSIFVISCSTVKDYRPNKPFVYQTNIIINGKFSTDERKQLSDQLKQQLDDSIAVEKQQKLIFWKTLKKPPLYDSLNVDKSLISMHALLNSLGYYRDSIGYDTTMKIVENQFRTTVNFHVYPRVMVRLDSIRYNIANDSLQQITIQSLGQALVKKGDAFAKPLISSELDRLS